MVPVISLGLIEDIKMLFFKIMVPYREKKDKEGHVLSLYNKHAQNQRSWNMIKYNTEAFENSSRANVCIYYKSITFLAYVHYSFTCSRTWNQNHKLE